MRVYPKSRIVADRDDLPETTVNNYRRRAERIADSIYDFQQDLSGDPRLSSGLTQADIETLDAAYDVLYNLVF